MYPKGMAEFNLLCLTESSMVCCGSRQVKLELITNAYFETGDFSQVDVLKEAYANLNQCLSPEMLRTPQVFEGEIQRPYSLAGVLREDMQDMCS